MKLQNAIQPSAHQIQQRAYQLWCERRRAHGHETSDWLIAKDLLFIEQNYECVAFYKFVDQKKTTIAKPVDITDQTNRYCRFCKKTKNEGLAFGRKAHALPESLGNKAVFGWNECDQCNSIFSDYETSLCNALALPLSLLMIRGKNGMRTYSSPSGLKIKPVDGTLKYGQHDKARAGQEPSVKIELATGKMTTQEFDAKTTYPVKNFKLLVKCALSVIPKELLECFTETADWITNTDHSVKPKGCEKLGAYVSHLPGPLISLVGSASVYIRKNPVQLPGCLFLMRVRNMAFQIAIPLCNRDWFLEESRVPFIPPFPNFHSEYGPAIPEPVSMDEPGKVSVSYYAEQSFGISKAAVTLLEKS